MSTPLLATGTTSDLAAQLVLDAIAEAAPWCSVHSADPGTTGAHEITSVGRLRLSWGPTIGRRIQAERVIFTDVPPGTVYSGHIGLWTAETGGSFVLGDGTGHGHRFDGPDGTIWVVLALTAPES